MQIRFINKSVIRICGFSVETSLKENNHDVAALYNEYFNTEKSALIDKATKSKTAEYYGLMWYTKGHERYRYLLGKEAVNRAMLPDGSELKELPAALYAVASFEKDYDAVKAWTDFFAEAIPQANYTPDYEHGFFFEYYPDGVNGNYELWTPVVKV